LLQFDTIAPFLIVLIVYGGVDAIIGFVIQPTIQGKALNLTAYGHGVSGVLGIHAGDRRRLSRGADDGGHDDYLRRVSAAAAAGDSLVKRRRVAERQRERTGENALIDAGPAQAADKVASPLEMLRALISVVALSAIADSAINILAGAK
jgi:hypothetical protein